VETEVQTFTNEIYLEEYASLIKGIEPKSFITKLVTDDESWEYLKKISKNRAFKANDKL